MNDQLQMLTTATNVLWLLLAGFLVFFMQAGFALVETGFTRAKNVAHTMLMNMMVFCIGAVGYWICGFAFQFGAVNYSYPEVNGNAAWAFSPITLGSWGDALSSGLRIGDQIGILGTSGFFLQGIGLGAAGIFAVGNTDTAGWNGIATPVTGIVGGNFIQIASQLFEVVSIIIVAFGLSYAFFSALKRAGLLRSRAEDEVGGLDLPEMGEQGYVTGGVGVPGGQVEGPVSVPGGVTAPAS